MLGGGEGRNGGYIHSVCLIQPPWYHIISVTLLYTFNTGIYTICRRAKMVKPREIKHWKDITPDMMSEEEAEGDDFIRHRPTWRSSSLNKFLEKLDSRFKAKHQKSLAKPRSYGSPSDKPASDDIPSWLLTTDTQSSTTEVINSDHESEVDSEEDQ